MKFPKTAQLLIKGYGPYKRQIAVLALFGFMSAFWEGIGISIIVPLLSRFTEGTTADDPVSQVLGAFLGWFDVGFAFKALLSLIVLAFILKSFFLLMALYVSAKITSDYARDERSKLMGGVLGARWSFLTRQKSGFLESILIKDVEELRGLFSMLGFAVIKITGLVVYSVIALSISYVITMIAFALGGLIFLLLKPFLYRIKELSRKQAEAISGMSHHVSESVLGIKVIRVSSVADSVLRRAKSYFEIMRDSNFKRMIINGIPALFIQPISVIFVVSIFSFLYVTGNFKLGAFVATMYLVHKIFTHIQGIQSTLYQLNEKIPYLERVVSFQEELARNAENYRGKGDFRFSENLEFKGVDFSYRSGKKILSGLTIIVKKGTMVGIVGKSGAGKTTIVDLLLRLWKPSKGTILIDGVDIAEINIKNWRENIAYVSQEMFVINDTVENNIKFYGQDISDDDVRRAAKQAYIYDFIQSLPKKFKTEVGERGVLLSGGEKQRLVLARALARNPKILILDEATSALDNESERMIQRAIEELKRKITIIVIAHRLSTLLNCDKIIFLENGKVKEEGPPRNLLANKNSSFYKLYNIRESV